MRESSEILVERRLTKMETLFEGTQNLIREKASSDEKSIARVTHDIESLVEQMTNFVEDASSHRAKLETELKDFTTTHFVSKSAMTLEIQRQVEQNNTNKRKEITFIVTVVTLAVTTASWFFTRLGT